MVCSTGYSGVKFVSSDPLLYFSEALDVVTTGGGGGGGGGW